MIRVIDFKPVDMIDEEFEYYNQLVREFTGTNSGKEMFHDLFDVDDDGCISMIRPPINKQIPWAAIVFIQNLIINQRERKLEKRFEELENKIKELLDGRPSNNS